MIAIGIIIIAIGAFCQAGCYLPINKVKSWKWENYWMVQGVFAWLLLPFLGALLAIPEGETLADLFGLMAENSDDAVMAVLFGVLWGIGGLTFGMSMRYLGVALGQSFALGTCAVLGTVLPPLFTGQTNSLTVSVLVGVLVTVLGIAVIVVAGRMKSASLSEKEKKAAIKEFDFSKGLSIALLCGFMSACFIVGLAYGESITFEGSSPLFKSLPATLLVTIGGFFTNFVYCIRRGYLRKTFRDYSKTGVWLHNLLFCAMAGLLWYAQFFALSMGKGLMKESVVLVAFSWCILMALNVLFSNVWGLILKEWKGCSKTTFVVLAIGMIVLIVSTFLPQLL